MTRFLRSPLFFAHRAVTLSLLRRELRRELRRGASRPDNTLADTLADPMAYAPPCTPPYTPVPRRILYVAASCLPYHISGYTSRTHELIRAMTALGADVYALTRPGYPRDRSDRLVEPESGVTLFDGVLYAHERRPSKYRLVARYALQAAPVIARRAAEARVGLIQAASNHVNALPALLAARRLGIPFQYEMRGLWELTRASRQPGYENSHDFNLGLELEGLVAARADRVLVISEQLRNYAARAWNIPDERFALLPNCVDPARIAPPKARLEAQFEAQPEAQPVVQPEARPEARLEARNSAPDNSIGYAGSLIGYEGLDTLIEAVRILADQGRDARLEIIGDGEARPELERLVARLGLADRVRLRGRAAPDAARAMLAGCALVCIPRKPFTVCKVVPPLKLVEAMAMAKPVIVPDLPVFRDELGENPAGFFFRAGDAADLARVIGLALADPKELAALGARARAHVLKHRQWRDHAAEALRPFWE